LKEPILDIVNDVLYTKGVPNLSMKGLTAGIPIVELQDVNIHYYDYYIVIRVSIIWTFEKIYDSLMEIIDGFLTNF